MSERDAKVRLELAAGGFLSMLREVERQAGELGKEIEGVGESGEKADKKLTPMLTSLKKGAGAAKDSLASLGSSLKSTLGQVATLGGALSFGMLVHSAIELNDRYDDIRFNVNKVAGNMETLASVQADIEGAASKTKIPVEAMADAYEKVFKSTGDLKFTKTALEVIGTTATATGESVENIANAAQLLQRKFKVSAEELPEALTRFIEKTGVGGKGLDELSNRFALMAGEASEAGMSGAAGISQLLGIMNQLDSAVGEKADPALKMMFQTLKNGSTQLKALEKQSGVKFGVDDTAFQKLEKLIASARGRKAAEAVFTGDTRTVFDQLAKPFDEAVATAKAEGKKGKELRDVGVKALEANLEAAGKSAMRFADIQNEFAEQAKGPKEQLNDAINKMKASFTKPEMISAIEKLAQLLPKLASGGAKLVEMFANHPLLAAGGFIAGRAGGAMFGSMAGDLVSAIGKGIVGGARQGGDTFAGSAFAKAGLAGAGLAFAVAAIAALDQYEQQKREKEQLARKEKIEGKADEVRQISAEVAGMSEAEAYQQYGDQGLRLKRGKLNDEERKALENSAAYRTHSLEGADEAIQKGSLRDLSRRQLAAEYGLDKKLGLGKQNPEIAPFKIREFAAETKNAAGANKEAAATVKEFTGSLKDAIKNLRLVPTPNGGGNGTNGLPPAPGNTPGSTPR